MSQAAPAAPLPTALALENVEVSGDGGWRSVEVVWSCVDVVVSVVCVVCLGWGWGDHGGCGV